MPSLTTEGLVLYRRNFGEADRMLTLLTKDLGKIRVIAKGVRRIQSRRAGSVELLNQVKIHLYQSKNYVLTEAESINTFPRIKSSLVLSSTGMHVVELLNKLLVEEISSKGVYQIAIDLLKILERDPRQIYLRAFEVKLLNNLGFWNQKELGEVGEGLRNIIRQLEVASWEEIGKIKIESAHAIALENYLRYYIEDILESRLVSHKVLDKLRVKKND